MTGLRDYKHHGLPRESAADKAIRLIAYAAIAWMCIYIAVTACVVVLAYL